MAQSKPHIPLGDGWSREDSATATCYCGAVQLAFPVKGDGLVDSFICNCNDCRKITASMFASNFIVTAQTLQHVRGESNLTRFAQSQTIATGHEMANYFCATCGTLLYRISSGFPDARILRIGTVDDFTLQETVLKPRIEQFTKDRVAWFKGGEGVEQHEGNYYTGESKDKENKL